MACNVTRMKQRYLKQNENRNLSDADLLAFEKRVNTKWNKFLNFFGDGHMLTPKELQRLSQLHAKQTTSTTNQTTTATNKTDQSIWTMKQDKK